MKSESEKESEVEDDESQVVDAVGRDDGSNIGDSEDRSVVERSTIVDEEMDDSNAAGDEERSEASGAIDQDDDIEGKVSVDGRTVESSNGAEQAESSNDTKGTVGTPRKRACIPPSARKGRAPAVKGLTIPFRTVKKVTCVSGRW